MQNNIPPQFKNGNFLIEDHVSFEHRFWLQIIGDNLRFIEDSLSSKEKQILENINNLRDKLDEYLQISRQQPQHIILDNIINIVNDIKRLEILILNRQLKDDIKIGLTPTSISNMINELEEYQMIIDSLHKTNKLPQFNIISHHKLWLKNIIVYTDMLICDLDMIEKTTRHDLKVFKNKYENLYNKCLEIIGYLRALDIFPQTLSFLNKNCIDITQILLKKLEEILILTINKELLGKFNVLVPDHMIREGIYYLNKLGVSIGDPTAPRFTK